MFSSLKVMEQMIRLIPAVVSVLLLVSCAEPEQKPEAVAPEAPHVVAQSDYEAGRYLVIVAGCNDCHTDGYLQSGGNVPEDKWMAGSALGWLGPWGTTYATNLRLRVQQMTEEQWVAQLKTRQELPPMPWMNLNHLSDKDARAIYRYLLALGPMGVTVPLAVPPEREPGTPYMSLMPVMPPEE
jgi:mono/diheme cytochrome c family protein